MKKEYLKPNIEVISARTSNFICASPSEIKFNDKEESGEEADYDIEVL